VIAATIGRASARLAGMNPSPHCLWDNENLMVRDGIYYAAAFAAAGVAVAWLAGPWFALPAWILAVFCLNFDVHVNRTPIPGVVREVRYQEGKFHVASREECSEANEQNVITVEGDGSIVVFKQIAGLIARRIVCPKKAGDTLAAGERVGLIKFGSRVDVLLGPEWEIAVRPGMRVAAGSSILARRRDRK
jgi:phosphatidylserine decarboxylase precursor-related protein